MSFFKRRRSASGHCFPNPKRVNQEKTGDIKALIREKNVEKLNELLRHEQIKLHYFMNYVYDCYESFWFLNELDIDSKSLTQAGLCFTGKFKHEFLEQVTNIDFTTLYQAALESVDIEFISEVAIIGLKRKEDSHYIFEFAREVKKGCLANGIYIFAEKVLEVAQEYLDKITYSELVEFLENAVIEKGSSYSICEFAKNIAGANKKNLIEAFICSKTTNGNGESTNLKEENDVTREFINWTIESNAMSIIEIIAKTINTKNNDLIISTAYCLILNNVDKKAIIDFAQRVKETKNTDCMYEIIKVAKDSPNKELRDLLIDELIQAITDLKDLKYSALLTREYQTISQESLHKLFWVIMEAFEILDVPMDKVERILAKLVLFEVLDETSLKCFISYMNFKAGILLPPVNSLSELEDELFIGGIQYQKVKPDKNNQPKGA